MTKFKNYCGYFIATILPIIILTIFFRLWEFDFAKPVFSYSQDGLFYLFTTKLTITEGWFFSSDFLGYPQFGNGFYLHDFPIHADSFNILITKFLGIFSQNPFEVVNYFFIITFALNSLAAFIVLRYFKISNFSAILVSTLFAFLPYHFARGTWHLYLSNYSIIPFITLVAVWLCQGKIIFLDCNEKQQYAIKPNSFFYISLAIAIFSASNGVYYAFYACIIFIFSWFIHGLSYGKFISRTFFSSLFLCFSIIFALILLYLPSFIYWADVGFNTKVANRDIAGSEFFALRIIDMLMPVSNHFLSYLNNLRIVFEEAISTQGERQGAALGILCSAGFLFLIVWLLVKNSPIYQKTISRFSLDKNEENVISNLASLNLLSILFATAGGLVMLVVMSFPLIRSHARFCLFIAFFSFTIIAIFFDKIAQKNAWAKLAIFAIFILALFDQTGSQKQFFLKKSYEARLFDSDAKFVSAVENSLEKNAQIFILPVFGFPEILGDNYEGLRIYMHSQNLHLSYPAIANRGAHLWQEKTKNLPFKNFIAELKKAGFTGVIIDRSHYAEFNKDGWNKLRILEKDFKKLHKQQIFSPDFNWIFFKI